jgi:hypothetical protein
MIIGICICEHRSLGLTGCGGVNLGISGSCGSGGSSSESTPWGWIAVSTLGPFNEIEIFLLLFWRW